MPFYKYSAVAVDGKRIRGRESAADEAALSLKIGQEGLFLVSCGEISRDAAGIKLTLSEVSEFSRQLSSMLSSGVPLIKAMVILSQSVTKPKIKEIYKGIIAQLQKGVPLSDSLALQGKAFPQLMINMYRAGESTGKLDESARKMAEHYEKEHRLRGKVQAAATYPLILLILTVLVLVAVFTFVLPQFFKMFEDMGELPVATRAIISISGFITANWPYIIIVVLIFACALGMVFSRPGPGALLDRVKVSFPKTGRLMRTIYTARFARSLSSLYASGIPMLHALKVAKTTIGNRYIESQFDEAIKQIAGGKSLSHVVGKIGGFDRKLFSIIMIGEETGRLESMLMSMADNFEHDAEAAAARLVAILEPVLIVIMAGLIGFVLISVILPIYQMYGNISSIGDIPLI